MSYKEGQFHIKQTPPPLPNHSLGPQAPFNPVPTNPLIPTLCNTLPI